MCRIAEVAAESMLDAAFAWPASAVWTALIPSMSRTRAAAGWKSFISYGHDLIRVLYRFSPLRRFQAGDDVVEGWSALDALALKALATVLS